jgi:hypothetical protein
MFEESVAVNEKHLNITAGKLDSFFKADLLGSDLLVALESVFKL